VDEWDPVLCSHRINTCAIHVRVLENDWCYLLQKREYCGGVKVTKCSNKKERIKDTDGALRVGLFDGLTSYNPAGENGGVDDEDCNEATRRWAESFVGKKARVLLGEGYAASEDDIGWYLGKVLSYSRNDGFTFRFDIDGDELQMDLDGNTIELAEAESWEDLANAMSEGDSFRDIENTPHQAFSAPPRPKKKQRTSLGDAMNAEGLNLFNAFRRERD